MRGREIETFVDASFNTCPDTSRSRSGVLLEFCKCPIIRNARYQKFVALSSTEAEYAASNDGTKETVWLRRVVSDIGFPQLGPTPIFCDNTAAIILANNAIATRVRTKHILRRLHYIREQTEQGIVKPVKIPGPENPTDFFTKVLGKRLFQKWRARFVR